jgi:hypothetical protein
MMITGSNPIDITLFTTCNDKPHVITTTTWLTDRDTYTCPASQVIPLILYNLKVHYHIQHSTKTTVRIHNQINEVRTLPGHFVKIKCNITLLFKPKSSKWSLAFRVSNRNFVHIYFPYHACHMSHQSHPPYDLPYIISRFYINWAWCCPELTSFGHSQALVYYKQCFSCDSMQWYGV